MTKEELLYRIYYDDKVVACEDINGMWHLVEKTDIPKDRIIPSKPDYLTRFEDVIIDEIITDAHFFELGLVFISIDSLDNFVDINNFVDNLSLLTEKLLKYRNLGYYIDEYPDDGLLCLRVPLKPID